VSTRAEEALHLADTETLDDLATFVQRAKHLDPDGAARLVGHGDVLAVYVSPVHGAGLPVVLGLRTLALARPSALDATVPLTAVTDRLARRGGGSLLPVPPVPATGVSWAGVSPPRGGWAPVGTLAADVVARVAAEGVAEVAAGVPDVAGGPAVARLRGGVWGRLLDPEPGSAGADVPAGAAFAAHGLGFLEAGPVAVFAAGPWRRLSTGRGHVLARRPLLG
jgi:hypothetical protein